MTSLGLTNKHLRPPAPRFSQFLRILVTCDDGAVTVSLDSNPILDDERGTRHERTRDETQSNAALRSLVPRPAFAKKYRDWIFPLPDFPITCGQKE